MYDSDGKEIGSLPSEAVILTLYLSGTIVRQTVAELDQRTNLDTVNDY
jgi:hypothetical protein